MERLCAGGRRADPEPEWRGVFAALGAARVAAWIREGASLRAAGQPRSGGEVGVMPMAIVASETGASRPVPGSESVVVGSPLPGVRVVVMEEGIRSCVGVGDARGGQVVRGRRRGGGFGAGKGARGKSNGARGLGCALGKEWQTKKGAKIGVGRHFYTCEGH